MGLKNKLQTGGGSPYSNYTGIPPHPTMAGALYSSKLHYEYSLDGTPNIINKPSPSVLDLNGNKPSNSYDVTAPPEGLGNV